MKKSKALRMIVWPPFSRQMAAEKRGNALFLKIYKNNFNCKTIATYGLTVKVNRKNINEMKNSDHETKLLRQ